MAHKWPVGATASAIAASVEDGIQEGRAAGGQSLPTVRELAGQLRVSPATVAAAYQLLRTRGLISGEGRRGTRVVQRPPVATAGGRIAIPEHAVDLMSGNPDPALLPSIGAALRAIDPGMPLYGDPPSHPRLVSFAASEFEQDGIPAAHVAVLGGALDAIERLLREFVRPGDAVAIEDPGFPGIRDLLAASGWTASPFDVDDAGPVPESFAAAVRRSRAVIVTPRAQNPTGAVMTAARAAELRRIVGAHAGVPLIENDHGGPVSGAAAVTLCGAGSAHWAVIRSMSKFLGPDLRLAVVAGDRSTINRLQGRQALGVRWVSHVLQELALAMWSDPSSGRRLARAADVYAQRRSALVAALVEAGFEIRAPSGINVWVPVANEAHVVRALAERGWAVAPGERFRIRSPRGIRVTCAALEPADARRFAADLAAVHDSPQRYDGA
jgi:DNA-binding transcriptional MocR family regulator